MCVRVGGRGRVLTFWGVLKSVKDMPVLQDGPPPGGFPSIRYARRVPSSGPTGTALFAVTAALMGYGFYKVGQTNIERRALKEEKRALRDVLVPVLQAEEDRRFVEARRAAQDQEAKIMAKVPGWKVGEQPYERTWMPPTRPSGNPHVIN